MRNEEVLLRIKDERNIVHAVKRTNGNWIGHILRRNCLLKHFLEEKIEELKKKGRNALKEKKVEELKN